MGVITKKDLASLVAKDLSLSQKIAQNYVSTVLQAITDQLAQGNEVVLTGFGKFEVKERLAREGINPATKERMSIPASKTVKFTPKKALKCAVNATKDPSSTSKSA